MSPDAEQLAKEFAPDLLRLASDAYFADYVIGRLRTLPAALAGRTFVISGRNGTLCVRDGVPAYTGKGVPVAIRIDPALREAGFDALVTRIAALPERYQQEGGELVRRQRALLKDGACPACTRHSVEASLRVWLQRKLNECSVAAGVQP